VVAHFPYIRTNGHCTITAAVNTAVVAIVPDVATAIATHLLSPLPLSPLPSPTSMPTLSLLLIVLTSSNWLNDRQKVLLLS
jgi:hypothetical protein